MVSTYLARWTILTIEHYPLTHEYRVVVTTDIAVHLYLQYSAGYRTVKLNWYAVRGLAMRCDVRWPFFYFGQYEQEEDGDTLVHTFKVPYDDHKHAWFTRFKGSLGGIELPSTSPLCVFPYCVEGPDTLHVHPSLDTFLSQRFPTSNYGSLDYLILDGDAAHREEVRTLLHFPKPSLPDKATIVEATLSLYWRGSSGLPLPATLYRLTQGYWSENASTWLWNWWPETWDTPGGDYDPVSPIPVPSNPWALSATIPVTWDLTTHIQAYYLNDWPLDFLILPRPSWAWIRFSSREYRPHFPYLYAYPPKLELTYVVMEYEPPA